MHFIIDYQVDTQTLKAVVDAVHQPERLMHKIGERLLWLNQERHAAELDPDGVKWEPLSPLTIGNHVWQNKSMTDRKNRVMKIDAGREVRASRKILYRGGNMLDSFTLQLNGVDVVLGFNDPKAKWHHFGTGVYGESKKPYIIRPKNKKALAFAGLVVKEVNHPGVPARRLIGFPSSDEFAVREVVDDYLLDILKRAR